MNLFDRIQKIVASKSDRLENQAESLRYLSYSFRSIRQELDAAEKHLFDYLEATLPNDDK